MTKKESISAYESKKRVETYDAVMDLMHPNRPKMVDIALEFLPFDANAKITAIDLGVGTGFFTAKFLEKFTNAKVIAVDGAQAMIDLAKARLENLSEKIDYRVGDFRDLKNIISDISDVDVVITSFSLHHLDVAEKTNAAKFLLSILKPGGWLLNADNIIAPTRVLEERFQQLRVEGIVRRNAGKDERFKDFAATRKLLDELEAKEQDKPITLDQELKVLKDAGFVNVDSLWKEYREVVICGQKEGRLE